MTSLFCCRLQTLSQNVTMSEWYSRIPSKLYDNGLLFIHWKRCCTTGATLVFPPYDKILGLGRTPRMWHQDDDVTSGSSVEVTHTISMTAYLLFSSAPFFHWLLAIMAATLASVLQEFLSTSRDITVLCKCFQMFLVWWGVTLIQTLISCLDHPQL